jgi:hypothetical protein
MAVSLGNPPVHPVSTEGRLLHTLLPLAARSKALADPEVNKKLADVGITVPGGTPATFGESIQAENVKWAQVAKDAGIVADE